MEGLWPEPGWHGPHVPIDPDEDEFLGYTRAGHKVYREPSSGRCYFQDKDFDEIDGEPDHEWRRIPKKYVRRDPPSSKRRRGLHGESDEEDGGGTERMGRTGDKDFRVRFEDARGTTPLPMPE